MSEPDNRHYSEMAGSFSVPKYYFPKHETSARLGLDLPLVEEPTLNCEVRQNLLEIAITALRVMNNLGLRPDDEPINLHVCSAMRDIINDFDQIEILVTLPDTSLDVLIESEVNS